MVKRVFLVGFVLLALLAARNTLAATLVQQDITVDTTWTKTNDPYLILGDIFFSIFPGATLTIDPGTVVKFGRGVTDNGRIHVFGQLVVNGTAAEPVHFTSVRDDSVGGDSNGDGSATFPQKNDFHGVRFYSGSQGVLNNLVFEYGGGITPNIFVSELGALFNEGGLVTVSTSTFSFNGFAAVRENTGSIDITGSTFTDNDAGIFIEVGSSSATHSSFERNVVAYNNSGATQADARFSWWGDPTGPSNPIVNPNGLGQPISERIDFIPWLGAPPGQQTKLDPVIIIPGLLGSQLKSGAWVIDPVLHTYDDLLDTLKANGYANDQNLFTFPYDWRLSNVVNAINLRFKIDEVKNTCQCAKVDLVAHSMGGLIAREYIQSSKYQGDVGQLIFLGTPHLGAPEAYLTWEGGEIDIRDVFDSVKKFFFLREAQKSNYQSIFDYVRNKPVVSIQELLPIYDYLKDKSSNQLRNYPLGYPINNFLEALSANTNSLLNSGVKISNFIGNTGADTIGTIRVVAASTSPMWEDGYPDGFKDSNSSDNGLERVQGDKTVPIVSSDSMPVLDVVLRDVKHSRLPEQFSDLVFNRLTGRNATIIIDNPNVPNFKSIIIKVLSPADILVIAPDGKKVGKDFTTGQEINEVLGAFYSGFLTDSEFVSIPNPLDGEYMVQVQGTGSGEYTLAMGYFDGEKSAEEDILGITEPQLIQNILLGIDSDKEVPLKAIPEDTTSPLVSINSPTHKDYLRSETLSIDVNISDDNSGIASSTILFDDKPTSSNISIDLFFEELGEHFVSASAFDMFFNMSRSSVNFNIIATIDSTISDINRSYHLGWIKDKKSRDALIKKVNSAKSGKKIDKKLLKALILDLKLYEKDKINERAYNLIKEDIEWLINN
ncbi:hypothetical protein EPN83_00850 [Patescibacteria group bacterium]|nr:MAG: hypothetical protein EPN83_00850 [Patescibacteria group bacterium]